MTPGGFYEAFQAALPGLLEGVERATDASADEDERLAAVGELSDALAELWPMAETLGEHVAELLAVLDAAVGVLPERADGDDGMASAAVLELLTLLEAHLAEPEDGEIVEALVELATSEAFELPLTPEAAARWLDGASGDGPWNEPSDGTAIGLDETCPTGLGLAPGSEDGTEAGSEDGLNGKVRSGGMLWDGPPDLPEGPPDDSTVVASEDLSEGLDEDLGPDIAPNIGPNPDVDLAEPPLPLEPERPPREALCELRAAPPQTLSDETWEAPAPEGAVLGNDALEMLAILASAIEESRSELLDRLAVLGDTGDEDARALAAAASGAILETFAEAAESVGFAAFAEICIGLAQRLAIFDGPARGPSLDAVLALPERLLAYLADPLDEPPRRALVGLLSLPIWEDPLSTERAMELAVALCREPLSIEADTGPLRPTDVCDEDLSLAPAGDIDASVLASFRREGPELARELSAAVQLLLAGTASSDTLRQAQRYAHTLKGSANICGVRAIASLGHHLEDLLECLAEHELTPGPALGDTLAAGADALEAMFDVLNGREREDRKGLRSVAQQVLDWANRIDREGVAALAESGDATQRAAAPESAQAEGGEGGPEVGAKDETDQAYIQVPARSVDELLRLVGELSIALSQSEEQLGQAQSLLRDAREIERVNLQRLAALEEHVGLRGIGFRLRAGLAGETVSPEDQLELEQYSEIYLAARQLEEGVSDARELVGTLDERIRALEDLTRQQRTLSQDLRQLAMGTRLVPAASAGARLQRAVRQTCRTTGKEADLRILGGDLRIDGDVLDRLMPALMHVLRNSVDHGIESPEEREQAGKPPRGVIEIAFRQSGDRTEVRFCDDGRGLDLARVKAKAVANGLIGAYDNPSPEELALLTLKAGFSTRDQVSQVSGRGVGMDVVDSTVRALNGSLAIESEQGRGYRLLIRLPASMLTVYCLLVRADDRVLALPASEVRQAVLSDEGEAARALDGWRFRYGGRTYPLVRLNRLLGLPGSEIDGKRRTVLLTDADGVEQAVMVDALLDSRELVVKPLGALVPRLPGLVATTILGDGSVAPILELRSVLRSAAEGERALGKAAARAERAAPPTVLIVDDSLGMRRALTQLVADSGYRPLTARDGMDAIRVLSRDPANCLLVDMEMPQMNGLELTAHLRAQPETKTLPIAMITSRSTERYRRQAMEAGVDRYFVKPYREEDVLDFLQQALEREPA